MSLPDYPIKTKEKDRLNRASMAKHVARLVNDFESKESFVVGIEGEWGSGKSSFINFVCEEIDPAKAEVIFFNPWNFSSQDQLIEDFFNALLETIEKLDPKGKLADGLRKYKRKLKNIDINPNIAGFSLFNVKVDLASLGSLRKHLEDELAKFDKKIMIIIDDIDRLDTKETLAIFKLVKVTANFSNCIFFLAYDRKRVVQRVDDVTNKSGDDYLKKIIQTTFRLPTISRKQIKEMIFEQIDLVLSDLFGEVKLNDEDTKRWSSIVYAGFPDLFQNIRDLKRYLSSLKLNLSVIGKYEVNIIDFVTLEAIRVFAPDFYEEIPKNQWLFTEKYLGMASYSKKDKRAELYQKIVENTLGNSIQKEHILGIVKELFPRLDFSGGYGGGWEERWSGNKQVCSDAKFDYYFQLSAPSDEISEEEFEGMLEQISQQDLVVILPLFEKLDSEKKLRNFLKKTHDRFDSVYDLRPKFFTNVAEGLFAIIGKIGVETESFLDFGGVDRQLHRLIWRLSEKIPTEEGKYVFLRELLSRKIHLYHTIHLLRVLIREKEGTEEHRKDMSAALQRTVSDLLPTMQAALDQDTLKNEPQGNYAIWGYLEWGKEKEIKEYAKKLAESKEDIFTLFKWFKTKVDSSDRGIYYQMSRDGLSKFIDEATLDKTFQDIEPSSLPDDKKELYELYKNKDKERW